MSAHDVVAATSGSEACASRRTACGMLRADLGQPPARLHQSSAATPGRSLMPSPVAAKEAGCRQRRVENLERAAAKIQLAIRGPAPATGWASCMFVTKTRKKFDSGPTRRRRRPTRGTESGRLLVSAPVGFKNDRNEFPKALQVSDKCLGEPRTSTRWPRAGRAARPAPAIGSEPASQRRAAATNAAGRRGHPR